jgi:hypothetical protein
LPKCGIQNDNDARRWDENNRIYTVAHPVLFVSNSDHFQSATFLALRFYVAFSYQMPQLKSISAGVDYIIISLIVQADVSPDPVPGEKLAIYPKLLAPVRFLDKQPVPLVGS